MQELSNSHDGDAKRALELTSRAMDIEQQNSLICAIQGYIHWQLSGDIDLAQAKIDEALAINPNDSLAWLCKSVWSSMWGAPDASVRQAQIAADLAPIDPMK